MTSLTLYTSNLITESAIAEIVRAFVPNLIHVYDEPDNLKKLKIGDLQESDYVILFGNFFPKIESSLKIPFDKNSALFEVLFKALEALGFLNRSNTQTQLFLNSNRFLFELMEKRIKGIDNDDTQPFITGLFNYFEDRFGNDVEGIKQKYREILTGTVNLNSIIQYGELILKSQRLLASERARNNSRIGTWSNGLKFRVANAPDLVNLTHEALYEDDIDVTIAASIRFSPEGDKIHYSMRSKNGTNVREIIISNTNGNGFENSAGGTRSVNLELDEFI